MTHWQKLLFWVAVLGLYFIAVWFFFKSMDIGVELTVDGTQFAASPALQGAWMALLAPMLVLAFVALFQAVFSFSWRVIGLITLAALTMGGFILWPLLMPFLLPLALFFLLSAVIFRAP